MLKVFIVVAVVLVMATQGTSAGCGRLELFPEKRTFEEAEAWCKEGGGRLAHIDTAKDQEDLRQNKIGSSSDIWVDGVRRKDVFVHTDGTCLGDGQWIVNQPDNFEGKENCLMIRKWRDYKYNDADCSSKRATLCEFFDCACNEL